MLRKNKVFYVKNISVMMILKIKRYKERFRNLNLRKVLNLRKIHTNLQKLTDVQRSSTEIHCHFNIIILI